MQQHLPDFACTNQKDAVVADAFGLGLPLQAERAAPAQWYRTRL
ncbi:MAG: hypothetical protein U0X20_09440 [Caldilineaceae bacterium]